MFFDAMHIGGPHGHLDLLTQCISVFSVAQKLLVQFQLYKWIQRTTQYNNNMVWSKKNLTKLFYGKNLPYMLNQNLKKCNGLLIMSKTSFKQVNRGCPVSQAPADQLKTKLHHMGRFWIYLEVPGYTVDCVQIWNFEF